MNQLTVREVIQLLSQAVEKEPSVGEFTVTLAIETTIVNVTEIHIRPDRKEILLYGE